MKNSKIRRLLVNWLYLTVAAHLLIGLLLPWIAGAAPFDAYHSHIEAAFWGAAGPAPAPARAQQLWWIALFGATLQAAALWMGALLHLADRHASTFAWAALIVGLLWWAPQDIAISLRADCWTHVWTDALALLTMLPPLCWLYRHDRAVARAAP